MKPLPIERTTANSVLTRIPPFQHVERPIVQTTSVGFPFKSQLCRCILYFTMALTDISHKQQGATPLSNVLFGESNCLWVPDCYHQPLEGSLFARPGKLAALPAHQVGCVRSAPKRKKKIARKGVTPNLVLSRPHRESGHHHRELPAVPAGPPRVGRELEPLPRGAAAVSAAAGAAQCVQPGGAVRREIISTWANMGTTKGRHRKAQHLWILRMGKHTWHQLG